MADAAAVASTPAAASLAGQDRRRRLALAVSMHTKHQARRDTLTGGSRSLQATMQAVQQTSPISTIWISWPLLTGHSRHISLVHLVNR